MSVGLVVVLEINLGTDLDIDSRLSVGVSYFLDGVVASEGLSFCVDGLGGWIFFLWF